MIIKHMQAGDASTTTVDFGDREPSAEELRRVREILGIGVNIERFAEPLKPVQAPDFGCRLGE